jgi:hypothetical protein
MARAGSQDCHPVPKSVFDDLQRQLAANRSEFYVNLASGPFYGFNRLYGFNRPTESRRSPSSRTGGGRA